MFAFIVFVSVF